MHDLETNMRVITSAAYNRLNKNLWWRSVAKVHKSTSLKERLLWMLDTARIEQRADGGVTFDDLVSHTTEFENVPATAGLELTRPQLEDTDGNGVNLASDWSRQIGAYAAYWPQKQVARTLLNPGTAYDGRPFFDGAHPCNPFLPSGPTYANLFPGVDITGDIDDALENLSHAIAMVAHIQMPNGVDPRMLRVREIFAPPLLMPRLVQLTNAKFLAMAAGSGAGSADVEALIRNMGVGQPRQCDELASAYGGSDDDFYLVMEDIISDDLGGIVYVDREPFTVVYHGPMTDAELARTDKLQWVARGRNTTGPGHPYLIIKCTKSS
jgi:hypothetical protein